MQYIKGLDAFEGRNQTAVTLGKFDGLHRGHQKLLNRIMKYAQKEDCDSVVCAFDMDRDCLMTNEERRAFLEDKVDYLIEIPFTREMMEMEAEKFIEEILHKKLHAAHIVVGTDFNFGHEKEAIIRCWRNMQRNMAIQLMWSRKHITKTGRSAALISGNFFSMEMFLLQMSFWGIRMRSPALWNMDSSLEEHLDFRR